MREQQIEAEPGKMPVKAAGGNRTEIYLSRICRDAQTA